MCNVNYVENFLYLPRYDLDLKMLVNVWTSKTQSLWVNDAFYQFYRAFSIELFSSSSGCCIYYLQFIMGSRTLWLFCPEVFNPSVNVALVFGGFEVLHYHNHFQYIFLLTLCRSCQQNRTDSSDQTINSKKIIQPSEQRDHPSKPTITWIRNRLLIVL